jgi:hypothetical protein
VYMHLQCVEGCTVSPRKSRRKSPPCFSSTNDLRCRRGRQNAQQSFPAGPPPATPAAGVNGIASHVRTSPSSASGFTACRSKDSLTRRCCRLAAAAASEVRGTPRWRPRPTFCLADQREAEQVVARRPRSERQPDRLRAQCADRDWSKSFCCRVLQRQVPLRRGHCTEVDSSTEARACERLQRLVMDARSAERARCRDWPPGVPASARVGPPPPECVDAASS